MKKINKIKSQHYVPRCYLKNFCHEKEQIWVFDKTTQKSYKTNIINVAQENYFYDTEVNSEVPDPQIVEKEFSKIEDEYSILLSELINKVNDYRITSTQATPKIIDDNFKQKFVFHITMQYLRTREFRDHSNQLIEVLKEALHEELTPDQMSSMDLFSDLEPKQEASRHAGHMFDPKMIDNISESLFNHIWVLEYNECTLPYMTSDHPFSKKAWVTSPNRGVGIRSIGVQVSFPISSNLVLTTYERTYFEKKIKCPDGSMVRITNPQNVVFNNSLQIYDSKRFIYSSSNDFELAKVMTADHPELSDPQRRKVIAG